MILLGLTGAIQSGKTSFANAIQTAEPTTSHLEAGLIVTEVADKLNASLQKPFDRSNTNELTRWLRGLVPILAEVTGTPVAREVFDVNTDKLRAQPEQYRRLLDYVDVLIANPNLARSKITPDNKETFRPLLQWIGGFCVQNISPTIWFDEIVRRAHKAAADGALIVVAGGVRFPAEAETVRAAGGSVIQMLRKNSPELDTQDITERERAKIRSNSTVLNDAALEDLQKKAQRLIADLRANKLQQLY